MTITLHSPDRDSANVCDEALGENNAADDDEYENSFVNQESFDEHPNLTMTNRNADDECARDQKKMNLKYSKRENVIVINQQHRIRNSP